MHTDVASWALEVPLLVVRQSLNFTLRRLLPDATLDSAQIALRRHVLDELSSDAEHVIMS